MRPSHFILIGFCLLLAAISAIADLGYGSDFLSALSAVPMGLGDKLGHAVLFGLLGLLANLASRRRFSWLATLTVVAVAVIDETSQRFLAHRSFDLGDLVAGLAGIVAGTTIAAAIARRSASSCRASDSAQAETETESQRI